MKKLSRPLSFDKMVIMSKIFYIFGVGRKLRQCCAREEYRQRLCVTRLWTINHLDVIVLCYVLIWLLANLFTFLGIWFELLRRNFFPEKNTYSISCVKRDELFPAEISNTEANKSNISSKKKNSNNSLSLHFDKFCVVLFGELERDQN